MGIFSRKIQAPAIGADVRAAAGGSPVGSFYQYSVGYGEEVALSVPTISRARDLIASMIGALTMKHYTLQWTGERYEKIYLPNEPWIDQPDPNVTRNFFYSNIFSDLFFYGRAFAAITRRRADDNRPAAFTWIPAADISTADQAGPQWFGPSKEITFNGYPMDPRDMVQILSPVNGLLFQGARAVTISAHLDQWTDRQATSEQVPGYLQQVGGETMSGEELSELAKSWAALRKSTDGAIGALNDYVKFEEYKNNPFDILSKQREYQALELARVANIPPYLVGIPTGGMTYQNAQQARQDLYLFGAKPYIDAIEQTFSMNQILPRNRFVEFDVKSYLSENSLADPEVLVEPEVEDSPDMEEDNS
jgi:phage portal protein BeeE